MIEELKNIIGEKIKSLELLKQSILTENEKISKLKNLKSKIDEIIESNIKILDLTDNDLINMQNVSEELCINIKLYRILLRNRNTVLDDQFRLNLQKLCERINIIIDENLNHVDSTSIDSIETNIEKLKEYLKKINDNYLNIESADIDYIINLLIEANISQEEIINILKEITLYKIHNYQDNREQNNVLEDTNLNEDDVLKLFLSYGLDFNDFKEDDKIDIIHHGKLDNIKEILETFNKYNIKLEKNIINLKSNQLTKIFIYSTSSNIIKLFDFCFINGITIDGKIDFNHLINYPSRFINRRRPYKKHKISGGETKFNIEETGCIDDFIKNYDFFKKEYIKLVGQTIDKNDFYEKIYLQKSSLFDISHEKILNTIKIFSKYGISSENYFKALSCFMVSNPEKILDMCVELNMLNYIRDNLTYITLINSELFNEISIANREGINCFGYLNRNSIYNTIKPTLYYRRKSVKQYIEDNNLAFEPYNIENIFSKEELKIYSDFDNIIENTKSSLTQINNTSIKLIEKLENEYSDSKDNMVYNINGIRISKFKVNRLYNILKLNSIEDNVYSISYILTKDSLITDDEFLMIYQESEKIANELKEEKKI